MKFLGGNKGDNYLRSSFDMVAVDDPDAPSAQGQSIPIVFIAKLQHFRPKKQTYAVQI